MKVLTGAKGWMAFRNKHQARIKAAVSILAGMSLFCTVPVFAEEWCLIGSSVSENEREYAGWPEIVCDAAKKLYVSSTYYTMPEGIKRVIVRTWNGAAWGSLGGALNVDLGKTVWDPKLAVDQDTPYVAWREDTNDNWDLQMYVKRWNGSNWIPLGGSLNIQADKTVYDQDIACLNGTPFVAWEEEVVVNDINNVYVKYWNGADWVQMGSALNVNPNTQARNPVITGQGSNLLVAWFEYGSSSNKAYVKSWNGIEWVQMGDALNWDLNQSASYPRIAFSGSTPYVVWREASLDLVRIYAKHWNGSNWEKTGGSIQIGTGTVIEETDIAADNDTVYVTWREGAFGGGPVYVKHWNGGEWVQDGTVLNINANEQNGRFPRITLETGVPSVVWQENNDLLRGQLYVKQWVTLTPTAVISPTATVTPTLTPSATVTKTATLSPTTTQTLTCTESPTPQPGLRESGYAVPNPFLPALGQNTRIVFSADANARGYTIRICNLRGQIVRTLQNIREWDGRADAGHLCEGGVYIYQIEAEGVRVSGKIVLIK